MFTIILPPLIGAFIGYVTNDIAIWMLFRPLRPIKLFGKQLPFTPGIIPKNRGRIASSIGKMVATRLISKDTLVKHLLGANIEEKIANMVGGYIDNMSTNEEPITEYASKFVGQEMVDNIIAKMSDEIYKSVEQKLSGSLGGGFGMMAMSLMGINMREKIDEMVVSFCQKPVSSIMSKISEGKEKIVGAVLNLYRQVVVEKMSSMFDSLDVASIVEEKVNTMDLEEVESMIRDVINHELKAIVWFGALLGFLLGCVNVLVNSLIS